MRYESTSVNRIVDDVRVTLETLVVSSLKVSVVALGLWSMKPHFHSRFSLLASEIFRMGHAQSGETNRTGGKIPFALWAFEVRIFQLLRNFFTAKPIRLLS